MKKLFTAVLILTSFVSYSQDSTPILSSEEEAAILESAPVVEDSTSSEILPTEEATKATAAAPSEETPVSSEAIPVEESVAPIVTEQPVAEEKIEDEKEKEEDFRVKAPMATFGVRGLAPETVSHANQEEDDGNFNHRKSHWIGIFGFETTKYKMPLNFQGASINFKEETREVWGGRLGIGRELYLGAGFLFGLRLDGYMMGTLFEGVKTADPEFPGTDISSEKDAAQVYGGDATAHFGWMFDYKTKNPFLGEMTYMALELFVEAGVGKGKSYLSKKYDFNAAAVDMYNFKMEDSFTTQNISAGLNFLSTSSGAFLYLKATQMTMNVDKREIRGSSQANSGAVTSLKQTINNPDLDPITIFAIGGGYKF